MIALEINLLVTWKVVGRCLEGVWSVYAWKVSGGCLEDVWRVSRMCPEELLKLYGRFLEDF